jgi:hypothetical protein
LMTLTISQECLQKSLASHPTNTAAEKKCNIYTRQVSQ